MPKVRVLRILEYEGDESAIKEALAKRGVKDVCAYAKDYIIREAFIGGVLSFTELKLPKEDEPDA